MKRKVLKYSRFLGMLFLKYAIYVVFPIRGNWKMILDKLIKDQFYMINWVSLPITFKLCQNNSKWNSKYCESVKQICLFH